MPFRFRHLPVADPMVTNDLEQLQIVITQLEGKPTALEARLAAVQAKLIPGPWTNPESFSAKLEEHATLQVRLEGSVVRFKGFAKAKEELPTSTAAFTLPVGFRPKETVRLGATDLGAGTLVPAYVSTAGVVTNETIALKVGHFWGFDDLTFNLT